MPSPSPWVYGMAAPPNADPYQQLEGELLGGGDPALVAARHQSGSWKDTFDPSQPGLWLLLALLVAVGVLHLGIRGSAAAKVGV